MTVTRLGSRHRTDQRDSGRVLNWAALPILGALIAMPQIAGANSLQTTSTTQLAVQTDAERLVEEMRGFSMIACGIAGCERDPRQVRRGQILAQMRTLGQDLVPALIGALRDPDAEMRRNAELAMIYLSGGYESVPQSGAARLDIREAIPALLTATDDPDAMVRAWAAHALAEVGPDADEAIPALIKLLKDPDEGPRNNSCIALGRMGPIARSALPALREALDDPSRDVRGFAQRAIDRIEKE
jgi:HEAT repeat protein